MSRRSLNNAAIAKLALFASSTLVLLILIRKNKRSDRQRRKKASKSQEESLPPHLKRELMKERRFREKIVHLAMKNPMYDNVRMLDPEGELLCTISRKKGDWYVAKNLATWAEDDHKTLVINFQPKNRSNRGEAGLYVRSDKRNRCVVCGDPNYHMRHYVVPFAYRTLFPPKFKSHLSHDIVILCPTCHVDAERRRQQRMNTIEEDLRRQSTMAANELVVVDSHRKYVTDHRLYHARSSALALLKRRDQLPQSRVDEYEAEVMKVLQEQKPNMSSCGKNTVHEYTAIANDANTSSALREEDLVFVSEMEYKWPNPRYIPGPELVVQHLGEDDQKIEAFVRGWRQFFLDGSRPRNLPIGWSVDSPVTCGTD